MAGHDQNTMKDCFIIMPITTPEQHLALYEGDEEHFLHVLEVLFEPAIEQAGLKPIRPVTKGSGVIQGDIISKLSKTSVVLCDMSTLNANVFFELGIRTALNKPVIQVIDEKTVTVPFDTGIINHHVYDSSLKGWVLRKEIEKLSDHIRATIKASPDSNSLWKYFGIPRSGEFQVDATTDSEKLNLVLQRLESVNTKKASRGFSDEVRSDVTKIIAYSLAKRSPDANDPQRDWMDAMEVVRDIEKYF